VPGGSARKSEEKKIRKISGRISAPKISHQGQVGDSHFVLFALRGDFLQKLEEEIRDANVLRRQRCDVVRECIQLHFLVRNACVRGSVQTYMKSMQKKKKTAVIHANKTLNT
jgi:hypothetical protein